MLISSVQFQKTVEQTALNLRTVEDKEDIELMFKPEHVVCLILIKVPLSTLTKTVAECLFGLHITPSSTRNVSPLPVLCGVVLLTRVKHLSSFL